jgi:hypothetical protein
MKNVALKIKAESVQWPGVLCAQVRKSFMMFFTAAVLLSLSNQAIAAPQDDKVAILNSSVCQSDKVAIEPSKNNKFKFTNREKCMIENSDNSKPKYEKLIIEEATLRSNAPSKQGFMIENIRNKKTHAPRKGTIKLLVINGKKVVKTIEVNKTLAELSIPVKDIQNGDTLVLVREGLKSNIIYDVLKISPTLADDKNKPGLRTRLKQSLGVMMHAL